MSIQAPARSTTQTPPPRRPVLDDPVRKTWTCDEFHRLGDMGAFEGLRPMLINGEIWEQGEMNPPHANALAKCNRKFIRLFDDSWQVRSQLPLVFGRRLDPMPDFAIVRERDLTVDNHPKTAELVVEIAESSLRFDTGEKMSLYAAAKIPEYWVVDLTNRQLIVYRGPIDDVSSPHGGLFRSMTTHAATESVSPQCEPTVLIVVNDLLD